MKFAIMLVSLFLPFLGNAKSPDTKWIEIHLKPLAEDKSRSEVKLYIPTDLLRELIEEGRVLPGDYVDSMNCGGNDCSINE
jgi:hypothetical protein